MFMLSTLVLLGIARVLLRIGSGPKMTFREALSFDPPAVDPAAASQPVGKRRLPAAFVAGAALATVASIVAFAMPARTDEVFPKRSTFVQFPNHLNGWSGRRQPLEQVYIDALKVDDYILSDYRSGGASQVPVNLHVAYYDSQQKGHSVHSPRSCIPGGGWAITSFTQTTLPTAAGGAGVPVNRAVIELGKNKQIVYYWFQQRGRAITNEYLVKWYIFWDALTRSRTDGALVRLSAPMLPGMDEAAVDQQIGQFATAAVPQLREYIRTERRRSAACGTHVQLGEQQHPALHRVIEGEARVESRACSLTHPLHLRGSCWNVRIRLASSAAAPHETLSPH